MKTNDMKIIGAFITGIAAAIVLPVLFGNSEGAQGGSDPWRHFIYEFQTLITGLMAVGGAVWTIQTMNKTDVAAQRRHEQILRQTMRGDLLRVDRAYAWVSRLEKSYATISQIADIFETNPDDAKRMLREESFELLNHVEEVKDYLQSKEITDAVSLFDGETTHALNGAITEGNYLSTSLLGITTDLRQGRARNLPIGGLNVPIRHQFSTMAKQLRRFINGLKATRDFYGEQG